MLNIELELNRTIESLKNIIDGKNKTINLLNEQNVAYYNKVSDFKTKISDLECKVKNYAVVKEKELQKIREYSIFLSPRSTLLLRIVYFVAGVIASWSLL